MSAGNDIQVQILYLLRHEVKGVRLQFNYLQHECSFTFETVGSITKWILLSILGEPKKDLLLSEKILESNLSKSNLQAGVNQALTKDRLVLTSMGRQSSSRS